MPMVPELVAVRRPTELGVVVPVRHTESWKKYELQQDAVGREKDDAGLSCAFALSASTLFQTVDRTSPGWPRAQLRPRSSAT